MSSPTHYGSIGLTLNYKGFYVGGLLYGSWGNKVYDDWAYYYESDGAALPPGFAIIGKELNRWTHPGQITNIPKMVKGGNHDSRNRNSTRWLYDGSFLRLRTVRIGYNVPANLLDNLGIGIRGINIFLLAKIFGLIVTVKIDLGS